MVDTVAAIVINILCGVVATLLVMTVASLCSSKVAEWNLLVILLRGRLAGAQREKWLEILSHDWEDVAGVRDRLDLLVAASKIAANPRHRGPELVVSAPRRQTSPGAQVTKVEYLVREAALWRFGVHFSDGTSAVATLRGNRIAWLKGGQEVHSLNIDIDITYHCGWQSVMSAPLLTFGGRGVYRLNDAMRQVLVTNTQLMEQHLRGGDDPPEVIRVRPTD